MDNVKTGKLIRELRLERGMTQLELAEKLHVSDRAVSKWERGLCAPDLGNLEPLAGALGCGLTELITGERAPEKPEEQTVREDAAVRQIVAYSGTEIGKNRRRVRILLGTAAGLLAVLVLLLIFAYRRTVFQRGDPLPYLAAAMKLDRDTAYVPVDDGSGSEVYITRRGDFADIIGHIQEERGAKLYDQMGGVYLFRRPDGEEFYFRTSVYWSFFQVWETPWPSTGSGG